jgi:putative DNA primase/helicase
MPTIELDNAGLVRPSRQADYITKLAGTHIADPGDPPPVLWLDFLQTTTAGNHDLIGYLQRVCGYCMTGCINEHVLFFIYGPGGNGKSTFVNALAGILGEYAVAAPLGTFVATRNIGHPCDLAMLRGARLVTVSETDEGRAWDEAKIKQLTGGDPVTARFMRRDFFTYRPTFKLMIVGNHKPSLRNVDDATRRRFHIIPFTKKPPVPDKFLEDTLKAEWPQILRWMLEGCLEWLKQGLNPPAVVTEATDSYFADQDTFGQWLDENCETGNPEWRYEATGKLFQNWRTFAEAAGLDPRSSKFFSEEIQRRGFEPSRQRIAGKVTRAFRGTSLHYDPTAAGINHD